MNEMERLAREENLASWRMASLLAFNGFLVNLLSADIFSDTFYSYAIPLIGAAISFSIFFVAMQSASVKYDLHKNWQKGVSPITKSESALNYYACQFFGPYIFSAFILSLFWFVLFIRTLCG